MSNGRLLFGLGAGWYEHEWRAYGYGFPEVPVRMRAFKEACEIIHRMWTEDGVVFDGEFYQIDGPINEPKGVQSPHPPLDRKSTRLNSSHANISYAVFCLKKKKV